MYLLSGLALASAADFDASLAQGTALLRQGQFHLAHDRLESARRDATNPAQQATATGWLGLTLHRMHRPTQAEALLQEAIATGTGEAKDRSRWHAALADIQAARGDTESARKSYGEALPLAAGDAALTAGVRLGQTKLLPMDQRLAVLNDIAATLPAIEPPEERAPFLVNLATQAESLGNAGEALAYQSFEQVDHTANAPPRVRAEALSGLARLYENRHRPEESLRLNDAAIRHAEAATDHDLLAEMEWRAGRLQQGLNHPAEALAAYQRAIDHIEAIRADIPVEYHDGRSSFRETLGPLYLAYAGLLLEQSERATHPAEASQRLRQAREAVELIKRTELEDFLGGRCAVQGAKKAKLEAQSQTTTILYPIVFPDRLELLVSSGEDLRRYTAPVQAEIFRQAARDFAQALRDKAPDVLTHSQRLYGWLVAPLEPWLRQHKTDTLVIVPDGVLRLIPLAALHDGQHYLLERYAIATSPGLSLSNPVAPDYDAPTVLLAGMSEPGPVMDNLPRVFFQAMSSSGAVSGITTGSDDAEFDRLRQDPDFRRSLEEKLMLPDVDREIAALSGKLDGKTLLNQNFTVGNFRREITARPYSIVHIASHGVFGPTPETSFLMTYDGVIDLNELERLFKSDNFKNHPVDLLVLSACQTARGDDRSPLGLAGVALRGNVRTALGSLWPVSDAAASRLMEGLYAGLRQPGVSKVRALRQAQQALLANPRFAHPFYWSPFILVGDWL